MVGKIVAGIVLLAGVFFFMRFKAAWDASESFDVLTLKLEEGSGQLDMTELRGIYKRAKAEMKHQCLVLMIAEHGPQGPGIWRISGATEAMKASGEPQISAQPIQDYDIDIDTFVYGIADEYSVRSSPA